MKYADIVGTPLNNLLAQSKAHTICSLLGRGKEKEERDKDTPASGALIAKQLLFGIAET